MLPEASLVVSLSALGLSAFSFWWSNLRDKRGLHFVPLSRVGDFDGPVFALCNDGKKDVLVTQLLIYFETDPRGSRYYPATRIEGGTPGQADLIGSGKTVEFRVTFLEPFGANFAQGGTRSDPWPQLYSRFVGVEVEWVMPNGEVRTARLLHSKVGFDMDGKIRGKSPISRKLRAYDLYAATVESH